METTLVLVKPDAVKRGLIAEILGRFERRGFQFQTGAADLKVLAVSRLLLDNIENIKRAVEIASGSVKLTAGRSIPWIVSDAAGAAISIGCSPFKPNVWWPKTTPSPSAINGGNSINPAGATRWRARP